MVEAVTYRFGTKSKGWHTVAKAPVALMAMPAAGHWKRKRPATPSVGGRIGLRVQDETTSEAADDMSAIDSRSTAA